MRAEEGDESIQDYAQEAQETQDRVAPRSWWGRLLDALNPFKRRL
ncbi:hypothetical protein [Mycolicibacter sinensis]|uniref:Uncharacterized protein n=1 Tax=Mycolicibacter sinensis (strain JDM601) TaxID=875328 RepID=F5YTK8_MYCSD|nr:hypothetical protein [Mycolicibacter sinensis]AEF38039.1 hypothetical protein JDM601_4039 [Mycolicibacter sinensis]